MAAQCTRRAAKSYSCGIHFFEDSKKFPNSNYIYFTLTRETARKIFWKDVLKDIDRKFKVGCTFNESRLQCTTPWGAQITLIGVDADERDKEKVLGQKIRWAYGDESAFFNIDLEELVYDMLLPATSDLNGGITLISTTSNRTKSFFHQVANGEIKGWELHKWSYQDNPYTKDQVQNLIDRLKKDREGIELTSGFRQMYLNEWVVDLSALVYKFSRDKNTCVRFDHRGFKYVIGVDLGFDDASSFTVCGWSEKEKILYILESYGKSELDISAVAEEVKRLMKRFSGSPIIVDGANKQAVQEIIRRHNLPLISAEKTKKFEHIQIMNSDFITGNIKLIYDGCTELIEEYETLVWDERKLPKRVELSSCDNHRCFVAGTKITLKDGIKEIQKIKIGDMAKTCNGFKKITNFMVDEKEVICLKFSNGTKLTCTYDHPFYTINRGFIFSEHLNKDDLCVREKCKFMMALSFIAIQILKLLATVGILKKHLKMGLNIFIDTFGKKIMGQLKRVFKFITGMETHQTTTLKILSALKEVTICLCTGKRNIESTSLKRRFFSQSRKHQNGTGEKKEILGIKTMVKMFSEKILKKEKRILKKFVLHVVKNISLILSPSTLQKIAALENVLQKKDEILESTTKKELVIFVKENSWLINTLSKYAVVYLVQQETDIRRKEKVYNITVSEDHEYFANGILVSNCDSTLYAWRYCYNYLYKPETGVPKDGKEEVERFWKDERKKLERERRTSKAFLDP